MINIDKNKYTEKVLRGEEVSFSFRFIDEKSLILINTLILRILSFQGNIFLLETLITIVREIVFNAFKANLKRIYFEKSGININDSEKYEIAMQNFKEDYLYNLDEIEAEITTNQNYYIQISFEQKDGILIISVFNNVQIVKEEYSRIMLRIQQSKISQNLADAYNDVYDPTEGAGLGLVLMVFLLKNSGIGADNLSITHDSNGITVSVKIPKQLKEEAIVSDVKEKILKDVESLPTFPENIIELQQLCNKRESSIEDISERISRDPALTADVIKLSNSAGFVPGKKITTIKEAVKIIGLKNLYFILTASTAKKILGNKYKKFELIWEHCVRVAYYSRLISKIKNLGNMADSAFITGLLHDIGKIVLLSTDEKIIHTISEITKNKQLRSSSILEEISIGISHAEIGGLIAEKWNFPDNLKIPITNHHSPLNSGPEYKELTYIVYFANMLCGIEINKYNYYYIETEILDWFKINSIEELQALHQKIKNSYKDHLMSLG
ncbi:MAG TPA: HDOD domain-containing protein [Spirochaetota bacterium]|nr:HDOD domain-containing protein [Spirochaetota bacterium]